MGILEFHFHECEFSPSMDVGDEAEDEAVESGAETEGDGAPGSGLSVNPPEERSAGKKGAIGALAVLAVLVALGALVKWKRGGVEVDEDEAQRQDVDVSA